jgi:hypothetical protein
MTEWTSAYAPKGGRTAIVLRPGSPLHAAFGFEEGGHPAAGCLTFLDGMINEQSTSTIRPRWRSCPTL